MKNIFKVIAVSLLAGLISIVSVSAIFASDTPAGGAGGDQVIFNVPHGIRWAPAAGEAGAFEIYTSEGFGYIASGVAVNPVGTITDSKIEEEPVEQPQIIAELGEIYAIADGNATYHIMNNITYDTSKAYDIAGTNINYFAKQVIESDGIVDGLGRTLTGFPIHNGTSLFAQNFGTIRNINIANPVVGEDNAIDVSDGGESQYVNQAGLIVYENKGTIENCTTSGSVSVGEMNFGAIAFTGGGTINNCINGLKIDSSSQVVAGIIAIVNSSVEVNITHCKNRGEISVETEDLDSVSAGGIIGLVEGIAVSDLNVIFCANEAQIVVCAFGETDAFAGGILGYNSNANLTIKIDNCVNKAAVFIDSEGVAYAGGIAGLNDSATTVLRYTGNFADITGSGWDDATSFAGGIISKMDSVDTANSGSGATDGTNVNNIAGANGDGSVSFSISQGDITGYVFVSDSIYYSASLNAFCITDRAGFSYIASDYYVNRKGDMKFENPQNISYKQLSSSTNYRIMNDINYIEDTSVVKEDFESGESLLNFSGTLTARNEEESIDAVEPVGGEGGVEGVEVNYKLIDFPIRKATGDQYSVLFNVNTGAIRNVSLEFTKDARISGAGILGLITATNNGSIEYCKTFGEKDVDGQNVPLTIIQTAEQQLASGLIAGRSSGVIYGCENSLNFEGNRGTASSPARSRIGGIVGEVIADGTLQSSIRIEKSVNNGFIGMAASSDDVGHYGTGGIIGAILPSGLVGDIMVDDCQNYGSINGQRGASGNGGGGGIVGLINGSWGADKAGITVSNCKNFADINNTLSGRTTTRFYFAGIVGNFTVSGGTADQSFSIKNCLNKGNMTLRSSSSGAYIAGIVGRLHEDAPVVISDCKNLGDLNIAANYASSRAGGIVGTISARDVSIENCEVGSSTFPSAISAPTSETGSSNGTVRVGGVVGLYSNTSELANLSVSGCEIFITLQYGSQSTITGSSDGGVGGVVGGLSISNGVSTLSNNVVVGGIVAYSAEGLGGAGGFVGVIVGTVSGTLNTFSGTLLHYSDPTLQYPLWAGADESNGTWDLLE